MAFPSDHAYPADLPVWLLEGHQLRSGERIAVAQFDQGEDRHREIRTFTPMLARVSTVLETQADFDRFYEWFEDDIQSGSLRFDTKVAGLNGALVQWWVAQFIGPYRVEIPKIGISIVTAELALLDGPYDAGFDPDTEGDTRVAPGISARSFDEDDITASFDSPGLNAWSEAEDDIEATMSDGLSAWSEAEDDIEAEYVEETSLLLLDGAIGYLLIEGGTDRILLEP
jgi:hypothetical protein